MKKRTITLAVLAALQLTACGGGGSSRTETPPPPPSQQTCNDPTARNYRAPGACIPRYRGAQDNLIVGTSTDHARAAGFTGAGVRIGVVDSAPNPNHPLHGTIAGRSTILGTFLPDTASQDPGEHGTLVGAAIAGAAGAGYAEGGIAPGAELFYQVLCSGPGAGTCYSTARYDLFEQNGIRIVNESISGTEYTGNETGGTLSPGAQLRHVLTGHMLVVRGTGNNASATQPSVNAALPVLYPELADNWLAVAGVRFDSNGNPIATNPGNPCGIAAQWCVSAPFEIPASDGTLWSGTSASTAAVTGVAALVLEAFPWMSAHNLQQTILTTATDIGAPGVDDVFGWGLVNAGRAVAGPAQFVGDFGANVTGGDYTFANDISGSGGLVKRGSGTLLLTGQNTYTGLTVIEAGTLGLSGRIAGDVENRATFASFGGTVAGDYTAAASATTEIQVGKGMTVGSTAALDGILRLLAPHTGYVVGSQETVLTAGQIIGQFDSATAGSGFFYSATLSYTGTQVVANLTRTSAKAAAAAADAGDAAVIGGERMDRLFAALDQRVAQGTTAGLDALLTASSAIAASQTEAEAVASLSSLAGEVHGTVRVAALDQTLADAAMLAERADALRFANGEAGVWIEATGRKAALRNGSFADADITGSGMMAGADRALSDRARIGAALSTSKLDGDLDGLAGGFDTDRIGLSLYGRVLPSRMLPLYLTGTLGYDRTDVETDRSILVGGELTDATSSRTDSAWTARLEAGYDTASGLTPFVALGAVQQRQGGFAESNATGLGLAADADRHTLTFSDVGVRARHAFDSGASLSGFLSGRWIVSGESPAFSAHFTGLDEVQFSAAGQHLPDSTVRLGFSFASRNFGGWRMFADVSAEHSAGGVRNASLGVGARYEFN